MKQNKEIKVYHSHDVDVQLQKMEKEAKTLSELIKLLREVTGNKDIKTIGAFTQWLCKEAGFKSPSFSAESMDLKDAYDNRWNVLLGEWELSFVMFISCACLASLEHWYVGVGLGLGVGVA